MKRLLVFCFFLSLAGLAGPSFAFELLVGRAGEAPAKSYTIEALQAFAQHKVVTGNEFVEGEPVFEGPLVREVLADAGLGDAERVRMTAANDYAVDIDTAEFTTYEVILALTMNGVPLTRRDKGPVWVIYPMSDNPELQDPVFNNRLIWQLIKIEAM